MEGLFTLSERGQKHFPLFGRAQIAIRPSLVLEPVHKLCFEGYGLQPVR
jgi:hypothetical protein